MADASRILVVANETIGGRALVDTVRERAERGETQFFLVVPRMTPRHGSIIYDEAIFQAAQIRVDLARAYLRREMSIEVVGEVGDPDPYSATMDAIGEWRPTEVIVSTKPATSSGWLRRDLIERIADASGLPVKHVVSDVDREGRVFKVTLVVANRTAATDHLLESLREMHGQEGGGRLFIIVVPQEGGTGVHAQRATGRLNQLLDRMHAAGLLAAGMIGDPDPYTATQNARQFFAIDEIVISTLGAERSGWLRADLVERVRRSTGAPVEHIVSDVSAAGVR